MQVSKKITYCGHELNEFVPQRTCAYISQHDLHYGEMTVRKNLDFSGHCLGVGTRYEMLIGLSRREKGAGIKPDPEIDAIMKATALAGQETSLVTNYVLKMLIGPAKALFMDEISAGLDSSTTFEIVKFMKQMVHIIDITMIISLLQPPPETFDLFDDIIPLSEGQVVYQGPRENVLEFFLKSWGLNSRTEKELRTFRKRNIGVGANSGPFCAYEIRPLHLAPSVGKKIFQRYPKAYTFVLLKISIMVTSRRPTTRIQLDLSIEPEQLTELRANLYAKTDKQNDLEHQLTLDRELHEKTLEPHRQAHLTAFK
ncbi:hypothetical protein GIB67_028202 [Kingdonia uniflora]|uniref:Uncharacterized protein n=1 Tax=Kingdonia uniflora TaxID=39325 RepID=A0A7J7KZ27_9MAGN|nr:hypothetical protein GIB67_028202 [Kingdonia uniflora]